MTKEELEKEVEEYLENEHCENVCTCDEIEECKKGIRIRCMSFNCKKELIVNFVEPREKQIAELSKHIVELQNDKGELIDRCRELEAQIEKMKADVNTNIKVAQQKKDWLMESKLVSMILQWEGKRKTTKEEVNNEEWYVIFNMNCEYEICRMCPKSGLFKGSYEECEKWIEQNS